ncbi:MAG: class I SAM-dependent methyltransferase [Cyanobacteria bacterium J06621_11]
MTSRYSDYDNWAWLYNQTMGPDYRQPQLDLLKRVLLPYIPAQGNILDLCCGTGQLIQPLIQAGYQVTGLDGSEDMLRYAKDNAPAATYALADARTFNLGDNYFDGAFSTSASLNHLMSIEELTQVFNRVYASLKAGGIFAFDLNHPEQLQRWWRSHPTEGAITSRYAWLITPHYNATSANGNFQVTIFQAPKTQTHKPKSTNPLEHLLAPIKHVIYKALSKPRFIGLRLKLIQNLNKIEPHWQRRELTYPVKGHNLSHVLAALEQTGFSNISLQTIEGHSTIDTEHSAHFICHKPVQHQPAAEITTAVGSKTTQQNNPAKQPSKTTQLNE